ncbi:lipopolysaccharide biosynthesis protein [Microcella alkalica]|uniref:O-antigen/teichoic acid export membrane protein n=1 Tax=Microcella alkalica TaxID=355930 RepID=A0A839ED31_9MICO|nr:hypothetical protein [Microcella alkalica]MBA8848144.1 O-antigen/teichoic acid export membrane protein [Microcella alkalica]
MKKNLLKRGVALLVSAGAQFALFVIIARELGADLFASFSVILGLGLFAGTVLGFGSGTHVLRLGDGDPSSRSTISALIWLRAISTAVIVAVIGVVLSLRDEYVWLAVSLVCVELLSDLVQGLLAGRGRVGTASVLLLAQRLLPLLLYAAGAVSGDGVFWLIFGTVGVATFLLATMLSMAGFDVQIRTTVLASRGYWADSLAASVSQLDVVAVASGFSAATTGSYAAAMRISSPVNIVTSALIFVLVPALSRENNELKRKALFVSARNLTVIVLLGLLSVAVFVPLGDVAVGILGSTYDNVGPLFSAFLVAAGLSGVSRVYQAAIIARGQVGLGALAVFAGGLVGLALILLVAALEIAEAWLGLAPIIAQVCILVGLLTITSRAEGFRKWAGGGTL